MNTRFVNSTAFHNLLYQADQETASLMQAKDCPCCSGKLHQSHYPRKGFGLPAKLAALYSRRFSFCCAACRRRSTPPSLRFFGRRRYVAIVFVLLCALRSSPSEHCCDRLAKRFGLHVTLTTWKRWLSWWRVDFPSTSLWVSVKAHFRLTAQSIPNTLLTQLSATHLSQRLRQALVLLSPLTSNAI